MCVIRTFPTPYLLSLGHRHREVTHWNHRGTLTRSRTLNRPQSLYRYTRSQSLRRNKLWLLLMLRKRSRPQLWKLRVILTMWGITKLSTSELERMRLPLTKRRLSLH